MMHCGNGDKPNSLMRTRLVLGCHFLRFSGIPLIQNTA